MNVEKQLLLWEKEGAVFSLSDTPGKIRSSTINGWDTEEKVAYFKEIRPQIMDYLLNESALYSFTVRHEAFDCPMVPEPMPQSVYDACIKKKLIDPSVPISGCMLLNDEVYTDKEKKTLAENISDYCATHSLYSERFKALLDRHNCVYESAKPVVLYSVKFNTAVTYWELIPKTVDCLDRDKTALLRKDIDNIDTDLAKPIDIRDNRFIIDDTKRGNLSFYRLPEHPRIHLVHGKDLIDDIRATETVGIYQRSSVKRISTYLRNYIRDFLDALYYKGFWPVKLIVDEFGIVDECTYNDPPLQIAIHYRNFPAFKIILDQGTSDDMLIKHGSELLNQYIDDVGNNVNEEEYQGFLTFFTTLKRLSVPMKAGTMFQFAINKYDTRYMHLLLELNPDVNMTAKYGESRALHTAAEQGDRDLVEKLIARGAKVSPKCTYDPPIMKAFKKGHFDIVDLLLEKGATIESTEDQSLFLIAAELGAHNFDSIKKALKYDNTIQAVNKNGENAFVFAAKEFRDVSASDNHEKAYDFVNFLIELGVDTATVSNNGETPINWAVSSGSIPAVELLLSKGIKFPADEQKLFENAVYSRNIDMVHYILSHYPNLDFKNNQNLMEIINNAGANMPIYRFLFEKGLNKNLYVKGYRDKLYTCLAYCLSNSDSFYKEKAQFLLENEFYADNEDWDENLLGAVSTRQPAEIITMLLDLGANPYATNADGESTMQIAKNKGNKEIVEILKIAAKNYDPDVSTAKAILRKMEDCEKKIAASLADPAMPETLRTFFTERFAVITSISHDEYKEELKNELKELFTAFYAEKNCKRKKSFYINGEWPYEGYEVLVGGMCEDECTELDLGGFMNSPDYSEVWDMLDKAPKVEGYSTDIAYYIKHFADARQFKTFNEVASALKSEGFFKGFKKSKSFTFTLNEHDHDPFIVFTYDPHNDTSTSPAPSKPATPPEVN